MRRIIDPPTEFDDLPENKKQFLLEWISDNLLPIGGINYKYSSYSIKHWIERDTGDYFTNGQLKGAMKAAGYKISSEREQNWYFNISRKSPIIVKLHII